MTVCDRGGVKFVKSSVCIHYEKSLIKKITITQIQYFNVQQILDVTFEFTGATRGFMIMSCAAAGSKRLDSTGVDLGEHSVHQWKPVPHRPPNRHGFALWTYGKEHQPVPPGSESYHGTLVHRVRQQNSIR